MGVIGRAANQPLVQLEAAFQLGVHICDDLADFGHCLGSNAVAREKKELFDTMLGNLVIEERSSRDGAYLAQVQQRWKAFHVIF